MKEAVYETVDRIAAVYESFGIAKYKEEAESLRLMAKQDSQNRIPLEEGEEGIAAQLVQKTLQPNSGGWVLTLASILGFSFNGMSLLQLSSKGGVNLRYRESNFVAQLMEGYLDENGQYQNSFTLMLKKQLP